MRTYKTSIDELSFELLREALPQLGCLLASRKTYLKEIKSPAPQWVDAIDNLDGLIFRIERHLEILDEAPQEKDPKAKD